MADGRSSSPDSLDLQVAKRELLAKLLKKEGIELHDPEIIYPRQSSQKISLSFAQQRLWFLDQLESGKSVYNICRAYGLNGPLDVDALTQSVNEIIRRHEILRTVFPTVDDQPVQFIIPNLTLTIPVLDLGKLSPAEQETETSRLTNKEVGYSFDLARGPLLRLRLVRLNTEKHVLVFTAHQIICDGWSVSLFFRELESLYRVYFSNASVALPELSIQFADYAVWQRELVKGPIMDSQLSYWRERLAGILPAFELATDRPRPAIQTFCGARETIEITESLTNAIKELGRNHSATLFVTLMAVFNVLLYRYTAQEEILIGFSISNRYPVAIENLIGFFVNTLVLRTNLSGDITFSHLLSRVRDDCREAYTHQDLSFEKLVEELQPRRDLARNPLFQVMFLFQNSPASDFQLPGITVEPIAVDSSISKFDLTLSLTERLQKLTGFLEYSTDLFEPATIRRMIGHFQTLLKGIVANPDRPISTLGFLAETEQQLLIVQWNNSEADYPKESCLHDLFEAQAERTPDAIALQFDGQQLSYVNLNARVNQLAGYLQEQRVGPGKLVGICVERSLEMVIGLLGILKAGGAYVPLDPAYPRERLAFMLEDAQVSVLLTQAKLVEDRGWRPVLSKVEGMEDDDPRSSILDPRLQVVFVDRDKDEIARQSDNNPLRQVCSTDLAYVIYTSGSTGKPKGVQVSHQSILNCLCAIGESVALTAKDVFFAFTTMSFDIAALELYLPLITGATLVLLSRDEVLDAKLLLDRLKECGATAMQATPSAWKLLIDAGWKGKRGFKILCGGEMLSRELADQLLQGGARLWNLYGPTETTIWSTITEVQPGEDSVPIGRPIANTEIYILDAHLQPMPIGVHGELYIGGDGLARGYLNRPELTAERFVLNPFSDQPDSRLYRTGDLARYRPDGNIEFLGRLDNQVKIRGHRVELGEIEATLNQHPGIKESVVVARPRDSSGEKELLGYIVPSQDSVISPSDLRFLLRQKLPDYMIPSAFVFLNALPLTPNGKIDRSKLSPPGDSRPSLEQRFIEPRTEIEELVAQMWREVLKLDKIGVYDNFFELGGHSLLATRVVARLRSNFNVDLPLRKLFELPTVAGLAEHIDFLRRHRSGISVPPIVPVPRDRPLPLSSSQRRLWFLQKLDPGLIAYNIPATFRITGALNISALEQAFGEIVNRHEILRTRIVEIDGQPLQEILPNVTIELGVLDLSHLPQGQAEAEAERCSAEDARQHYNLAEAPLMRAKLLRLCEDDHFLILSFHHIVCDGSSLIILYQELGALYEAFLDGKACNLPSLPVQYADYAVWQHERLQGEVLESQLAYWKRQLGTGLRTLSLPTDYERPVVQSYRGARLTKTLSEELTKGLKDLSRREGVTLFMALLATLDILLCRHTGQEDIIVGSTIAGRNRPETDGLIGFFINALALRTDLSGNPTFPELLKQIREVCLDAYTHQDLPFERVVEEINPQRDLGRNPLFQVMFNMADTSERVLKLAGCQTVKLSTSAPEAKFDIIFHAPEVDGRIELATVYNVDLFSEHRIANLLDQFTYLLSQVADRPQRGIDEFSLVTPSAVSVIPDPTESLDDTWQGSIHELFAKQAERAPNFPAVIDSDNRWSYGELDRRSNQLANYLIAQRIEPNDIVTIYAQRSAALVIALLGILKAGAAFEIFDPAYPASRLISYLRIGKPRALLHIEGAGETAEELKEFVGSLDLCCQLTILDCKASPDSDPLKAYLELDPNLSVHADDPAYVAFTSGSTGEAKGVLSRHGPITHFLPWQKESFELVQTDRFALLSGLAYNHLHRDIFTALYLGATLYIPEPQIARSPDLLTEWLQQNEITILHLTPALGQLLLTAGEKTLPSIRRVFFGGDVLTWREVRQIRHLAPNAEIGSFYGATETQRAVGYFQIPDELSFNETDANRVVPLGQGIKDVQLLLLNRSRQIAGIGELGELYVRSPHLAKGYIDDEKRTQEMFASNPFANDPKDRIYKTGELGRYLPDGNVEWAGRNDRRVNIRGFRVELEEVELVLKQHPAVQNAAVVLRDYEISSSPESLKPETRNRKLDQRLVAYVVAEEERQSLIDLLHSYISTRLPDYMVPSYIVVLDRLPLSPNGKVDYKALPPAERSLTEQTDSFIAPGNDLEAKLCEIFSHVLGIEQVGVNDNFFRVGGHSLLAAQAAVRIKETFGVGLELRTFLESPTVAALARHIEIRIEATDNTPVTDDTDREEIEL
jgi:amino acid adenylation domain-containing protein